MDKVVAGAQGILIGSPLRGDDFIDRLHYFITSAILLVVAAYITYKEGSGTPIDCFPPPAFKEEGAKETVNEYCFARELYFPTSATNHSTHDNHAEHHGYLMDFGTTFYKWAPLILVIQAFMFKGPKMLWTKVSGRPGQDLRKIRDLVTEARSFKKEKQRLRRMQAVSSYFETFVTDYQTYDIKWIPGEDNGNFLAVFFCFGRHSGSYLSSLYLFIKILNFFNVILNFLLLTAIFDVSYWRYGYDGLKSIFTTGDWGDPYNFPRILMCDFEASTGDAGAAASSPEAVTLPSVASSDSVVYKVKCMMSINLLLEKVFLVIWFWLLFLFCVTISNLFSWYLKIKEPFSNHFFIQDYMKIVYASQAPEKDVDGSSSSSSADTSELIPDVDRDLIEHFVEDYIRSDGVFLLRLLELNADRSIAADVIICLWNRYKKVQRFKARRENVKQIEKMILEAENKGADMEKFLQATQQGRRAKSNMSLNRLGREVCTEDVKSTRSLPLPPGSLGNNKQQQGLNSFVNGGDGGKSGNPPPSSSSRAGPEFHIQDEIDPGVNIPLQDLGNRMQMQNFSPLGSAGLGGGRNPLGGNLDIPGGLNPGALKGLGGMLGGLGANGDGDSGGFQMPGSLGGLKLPGGMDLPGGMNLPGGMDLPGGMKLPGGMDLPGGMNLPGGMDLPGGMKLPGGLDLPGGMKLPGGLDLPGGMKLPGGMDLPGGMKLPGGMDLPGGMKLPGGMDLPGGMNLPGGFNLSGDSQGGASVSDSLGGLFNQRF